MDKSTHCLLGTTFSDIALLQHTFRTSNVLNKFSDNYTNVATLEQDYRDNQNYFGHDLPFHKIEAILPPLYSSKTENFIIVTDKIFCIDFLKVDEFLMRRYPKTSFFLRNCTCDHIGSQWLLKNKHATLLLVSLYKGKKNEVTVAT